MNDIKADGNRSYLIAIVLAAVLGGLLFGYDTAVILGAEKGLQAFFMEAKDFQYADGWHGFTNASALIGCIIGSALSGLLSTHLGRKKSLIIAGLLFYASALGSMFPEFLLFKYDEPTYDLFIMFNVYRIIGGVGVGLASAICPMYISEVTCRSAKGVIIHVIIGQLAIYFINFFILSNLLLPLVENMNWRNMFVSETIPAGLFVLFICFIPETPRYLVSIGRDQMALGILGRINGPRRACHILLDIKNMMTVKTEQLMSFSAVSIAIVTAAIAFTLCY